MRNLLSDARLRVLVALLWAALLAAAAAVTLSARPAAAGETIVRISHDHGGSPLDAKVWTDRGDRSVYHAGDPVHIRFEVSDDAYVCVYDIDTEGQLRVLFPGYPGDDGFVRGGRVMSLPTPDVDYDFTASGPPGLELLVIVASRYPLVDPWPWCSGADGGGGHDGVYHGAAYHEMGDGAYDWSEPEFWYELDSIDDEDWAAWSAARGEYGDGECVEWAPWGVHGLLITGDPFIAMQRVNRQLVTQRGRDGDVAIDYDTFHIEQPVDYPRYLCGDCHGRWSGYDPYADRCSVFSVRVNTGWRWYPRPVYVVIDRPGPRYVYVRHEVVAPRNRAVRRTWRSNERDEIQRRFRDQIEGGRVPPIGRSTQVYPKVRPEKSTHGYDWKTVRYRGQSKTATATKTGSGETSVLSKRVRRSVEAWKEARGGKQRTVARSRAKQSGKGDTARVRKADRSRGGKSGSGRATRVRKTAESGKSKPAVAKRQSSKDGAKSSKVRSGGSGRQRSASSGKARSGGGKSKATGSGRRVASGHGRGGSKKHR